MSHIVAISSNSRSNLCCVLEANREVLRLPAVGSGGWGMAYYNGGELLSRIEPRDQGVSFDTAAELDDIEAEIVVLHTREASVGGVRRENTHPFRFQSWAFAHNGTLGGFEDYRGRILEAMPPFIHRRVRGDTDSEHLFHLFLSFLYDAGEINRVNPGTTVIRNALVQAVAMTDQFAAESGHAPSPASAVVTDGYSVVVLGRGIPVQYALIEGICGCERCRSSRVSGTGPSPVDHSELRAVLIMAGPLDALSHGFQRLDDGGVLAVTSDHRVEFGRLP
jgi:glutamine amidotransferase